MRKCISGVVVGMLFLVLFFGGMAALASPAQESESNIRLVINGEEVTPRDAQGRVVAPFLLEGTTFLPLRVVSEALGYEVAWVGSTSTVYIGERPTALDNTIRGTIRLVVNGEEITPQDAQGRVITPFLLEGTTFLPVRAVSEALGYDVIWIGETSTVHIDGQTQAQSESEYGIRLSVTGIHVFRDGREPLNSSDTQNVNLRNIGSQPVTSLSVSLAGENPDRFILVAGTEGNQQWQPLTDLAPDETAFFLVMPNSRTSQLGTQTAEVIVSSPDIDDQSFLVSFTVLASNYRPPSDGSLTVFLRTEDQLFHRSRTCSAFPGVTFQPMSLRFALNRNMRPCSACNPPTSW